MTINHRFLTFLQKTAVSEAGFLLFATVAGFIFSYIFQVMMGRMLGPEAFGSFGALYAIFLISGLIGQALMQAIATNITVIKAQTNETTAIGSFSRLSVKLVIICLLITAACLGFAQQIADFFRLESVTPVILLCCSLFMVLSLNILMGLQQGLARFRDVGITGYLISQGFKLIIGIFLVYLSFGLLGAVGALLASTGLAVGVGLFIERRSFHDSFRQSMEPRIKLTPVLLPTLILAVFLALPSNIDIMLVKHFFTDTDSGIYAALATIGKVVYFLPMSVSFVLLPKTTEAHALGRDARLLLLKCLALALVLSGVVMLICWVFPDILTLFFGDSYVNAKPLINIYTAAMLLFSLNIVMMHFSLGVRRIFLMILADLFTLAQVFIILMIHDTLSQVIWILFYGNLAILFILLPSLVYRKSNHLKKETNV